MDVDMFDENEETNMDIINKTMIEIFSVKHANLTSVVLDLMYSRGCKMFAQKAFCVDEASFKLHTDNDMKLVSIRAKEFCAIGVVEKAVVAGLRVVCASGCKDVECEEHMVSCKSDVEECATEIIVKFTLLGKVVGLAIRELRRTCYFSLYVDS